MKLHHVFFMSSCLILAGCPSVSTDQQQYDRFDTVTSTLLNDSSTSTYVNGCVRYQLMKVVKGGEIALDDPYVCIHNNALEISAGDSVSDSFEVTDTGDYRVVYQTAEKCADNAPISKSTCNSIKELSSTFSVSAACAAVHAPVCGSELTVVQCITAPCDPIENYKTYGNSCQATVTGSPIHFDGACGNLEGANVNATVDPVMCIEIYAPVCALNTTQVQCITAPCDPIQSYQTYSTSCDAGNNDAEIAFTGECGDIEGQSPPPTPTGPQFCTMQFAPVCGVIGTTTQDFSNSSCAAAAGALVISEGNCL